MCTRSSAQLKGMYCTCIKRRTVYQGGVPSVEGMYISVLRGGLCIRAVCQVWKVYICIMRWNVYQGVCPVGRYVSVLRGEPCIRAICQV
jgi:hypothetical protein